MSDQGQPSRDPIQWESLCERVGGSNSRAESLLELFALSVDELIDGIELALQKNDLHKLAEAAHLAQGSAAMVSAEQIKDTTRQIERFAKENDRESIDDLLRKLQFQVAEFKEWWSKR